MKRKFKIQKKYTINLTRRKKVIVVIILILFLIWNIFSYLNNVISSIIIEYAEVEIEKLSTLVINEAINSEVTHDLDVDNLYEITTDYEGYINSIDLDPIIVNKLLSTATSEVQKNLNLISKGELSEMGIESNNLQYFNKNEGIIFKIPIGVIFNNTLLANYGFKVPVRLSYVGNIESNIQTKVTEYGMNNAVIEVFVRVTVNQKLILPLTSKVVTTSTDIPVAIKIINGKVPDYYLGEYGKETSSLQLPVN